MKGMIPVHPREIENLQAIAARARAPQITYSESIQKMREEAERRTRQLLGELDDYLDELIKRAPIA